MPNLLTNYFCRPRRQWQRLVAPMGGAQRVRLWTSIKRILLPLFILPLTACAESNQIVLYDGFGSGQRFVLEGRVIEQKNASAAQSDDGWLSNLWRNLSAMRNSEKSGVALTLKVATHQAQAVTDDEGFFRLTANPAPPLVAGWHTATASGRETKENDGRGQVLIVSPANSHGVISDFDDTVIVSEVTDKKKLLENTFLQNPLQRQTFPGTAAFYQRLLAQNHDTASAPMFYLSASPRQLAANITAFLTHNNFPKGALITKQISGADRDPLRDQMKYKLAKIETIFAALPWVRFTLIGDDGEHDPEIYKTIQEKYPQRVAATYIRKVHPSATRITYPGQRDLAVATAP